MPRTDLPLADIDIGSVIAMDDPRHARLRSVVARGFTPRTIAKVDEYVKAKAAEIITRIQQQFPNGECDLWSTWPLPCPLKSSAK
jgi:methyl-branched lipid omega-hydroxylase